MSTLYKYFMALPGLRNRKVPHFERKHLTQVFELHADANAQAATTGTDAAQSDLKCKCNFFFIARVMSSQHFSREQIFF